ncbi:hypothetical protein FFK22_014425 [Mycobacterium sp. KBS0706]|uniref:hypothetical protein n=1 Tax=Mycobacterium sp. KBS0706 TaxID=2578109 RepID=UPI00110FE97B|nr:hypothetical protein [Mycobacterium sp. KBS0706]TSD88029.1 hypothetical protein FFK22_014425 [Mycobacterium sp. KBS0706]
MIKNHGTLVWAQEGVAVIRAALRTTPQMAAQLALTAAAGAIYERTYRMRIDGDRPVTAAADDAGPAVVIVPPIAAYTHVGDGEFKPLLDHIACRALTVADVSSQRFPLGTPNLPHMLDCPQLLAALKLWRGLLSLREVEVMEWLIAKGLAEPWPEAGDAVAAAIDEFSVKQNPAERAWRAARKLEPSIMAGKRGRDLTR